MAGGIGSNVQVWNAETGELFAFLESQAMVDQSLNFKDLLFDSLQLWECPTMELNLLWAT